MWASAYCGSSPSAAFDSRIAPSMLPRRSCSTPARTCDGGSWPRRATQKTRASPASSRFTPRLYQSGESGPLLSVLRIRRSRRKHDAIFLGFELFQIDAGHSPEIGPVLERAFACAIFDDGVGVFLRESQGLRHFAGARVIEVDCAEV